MRTLNVYTFPELSAPAKEEAINALRYDIVDSHDLDHVLDDYRSTYCPALGLNVSDILYDTSCSQGSGACILGDLEYPAGLVKNAPPKINDLAKRLFDVQRKNFFSIKGKIESFGRYTHDKSNSFDLWSDTVAGGISDNAESEVIDIYRSLMRLLDTDLKKECEFFQSDIYVAEYLSELSVGYEFTEKGTPI